MNDKEIILYQAQVIFELSQALEEAVKAIVLNTTEIRSIRLKLESLRNGRTDYPR